MSTTTGVNLPRRDSGPTETSGIVTSLSTQESTTKAKACLPSTRDAPLRFINASHPSEVKSLQNRKLIKQHAMLDAQQRRREASASNMSKKRALKAAHAANTSIIPRQLLPKGLVAPTPGSTSDTASEVTQTSTPEYEDFQAVDTQGLAVRVLTTNVPFLSREEQRIAILRYPGWSSVDPFRSMPQFANPLIRVEKLQYLNKAFFPSLKRSQFYINALVSNPLVLLSDAHPGIILQDALDENTSGGNVTIAAKGEIYTLLNKYLRSPNPAVQAGRPVIAGIFNLIWLELSYGNLEIVQTHISGLRRVFEQIGGIAGAGFDPNLMIMAVYQGLETAIYFEIPASTSDLRITAKLLKEYGNTTPKELFWESPINSNDFSKTIACTAGNSLTVYILQQSRQLTVRYLDSVHYKAVDSAALGVAESIYQDLLDLTPASTPSSLPAHGDWVYECVRIAAIIWATAIIEAVPISLAVPIATSRMPDLGDPVQVLLQALKRTNTEDCWNEMIGSFMWVCKIGCVAAPSGSVAFKWFYLEVARATVLGLRSRRHADVLYGCDTVLRLQAALRTSFAGPGR